MAEHNAKQMAKHNPKETTEHRANVTCPKCGATHTIVSRAPHLTRPAQLEGKSVVVRSETTSACGEIYEPRVTRVRPGRKRS
jgi:hypothetical protein